MSDDDERGVALEEVEEALLEGDSRFAPGSARAALSHALFRTMFIGFFLSSIGTWMQQAVLGKYGYDLRSSAVFVGALLFAQLGPVLFLGPLAGVIADAFDRRKLLFIVSLVQLAAAGALALVVLDETPNLALMIATVAVGGIAGAVFMPAYSALLPSLVGQRDLPGAISLQSAQMNLSRVIGPPIGVFLMNRYSPALVFAINGVTFLFVIGAMRRITMPEVPGMEDDLKGWRRLVSGFSIARRDPVITRALVTVTAFSTLCLLWVGQLPVFATEQLGVAKESNDYGILYACMGIGAAVGSISMGTVFSQWSKPKLVRVGLVAYAAALAVFAMVRSPGPAYPAIVVLGIAYFGSITALNTSLQARLAGPERGRVMALWMMGFGGAVSVANLALSPLVEAVGMPPLMLAGAVIALGLAWYADVSPRPAAP